MRGNSCKRGIRAVSAGTCLALALTGCQTTQLGAYNDPADSCNTYRQPLIQTEEVVARSTVQGAVAGALVGALAGYLISGDARGAAIGGAAGAVGGGVIGNQMGQSSANATRSELISELDSRASGQASSMRQASGTIQRLTDCREGQIASIKTRYDNGALSSDQAKAELAVVRDKVTADNRLIAEVLNEAEARYREYVSVAEENGMSERELVGNFNQPSTALPWTETTPPPAQEVATKKARTAARVRQQPSTSASVLGTLPQGDLVQVTGESADGQWSKVSFQGREGFIYNDLLVDEGTVIAQPRPAAPRAEPQNEVQALALGKNQVAIAQRDHAQLEADIDNLFAAVDG